MAHKHSVYDTDAHFSINPFTRAIKNESTSKVAVIQHDHNSERFTFEIPRMVDGHDMSLCDRVEVHYINMDSTNPENISADIYEVDDLDVSPDDRNFVICSWLLSQNATKYAGSLNFLVRFVCLDGEKIAYAWHTAIFTGISVSSGILNNAEEIVAPYVDVLAQWKADLFGVGDTEEQRLLTVSAEQQAAIAAKGQAVLESIPDEYEALQAQADENTRIKAGAIVLDAEGESVVVNDASDCYFQGLKLFGRSTQNGTPTPDAPVDIVSIKNPTVSAFGKNFITYTISSKEAAGVTFTVNADGSVTLNGTATDTAAVVIDEKTSINYQQASLIASLGTTDKKIMMAVGYVRADGSAKDTLERLSNTPVAFSYPEEAVLTRTYIFVYEGTVCNNDVVYPMIRLADTTHDFEKPKVSQNLQIHHTLPGIPVASGGNYTDADGQQWICDEVDLARGVYVQRVGTTYFDGADGIDGKEIAISTTVTQVPSTNVRFDFFDSNVTNVKEQATNARQDILCNYTVPAVKANYDGVWLNSEKVFYGRISMDGSIASTVEELKSLLQVNPIVFAFPLAEPIETALTDAEISAFKALHSNKPNTTILNDAGAFMAVEYVADTKTYIDNKIKELMEGVTE